MGDDRSGRTQALCLLALALAARLPIVLAYPAIHGGDSIVRLARSNTLLLAYQLPLPQLLVFAARAVDPDPLWARLVFVLVGSLVPAALASLVGATAGPWAGRAAGALLALHPLFVYYSLVPYQEGPMLLLLLLGAMALLRGNEAGAGLALGLACLCRYEAWIAAGLAAIAGRRRPVRAIALFGWAPILWIAYWRGLSAPGTYVLDLDPGSPHVSRLAFLLSKVREYSGDPLLLLALAGAALAWRRRDRRWAWGAAYLSIMLTAVALAGHEFPPGSGRVSERLAHVPVTALCALAGLAVGTLAETNGPGPRRAVMAMVLGAALLSMGAGWLRRGWTLVEEANRDPSLRLAAQVARLAQARLPPGGRLAVAGPPVPEAAIEEYVRKVEGSGGDAARARAIGREMSRHSSDAYAIAAHLPRPPGTVILAGTGPAELAAVFDDAPEAARFRTGAVVARFAEAERGVTVYASPAPGRRQRP